LIEDVPIRVRVRVRVRVSTLKLIEDVPSEEKADGAEGVPRLETG